MSFFILLLIAFAATVVIASFFEWTLHRFVMHRPVGKFTYAYDAHTRVHHHVFKADHTYHLSEKDKGNKGVKSLIRMAWWNGPVLVAIVCIPSIILAICLSSGAIVIGGTVAASLYFFAYEYMHWCMHLPREPKMRLIERSWVFRKLNGHHLLHHRYMQKNFNVVLPLADLCLGTLMRRAKSLFAQPVGPAIPNVQPRSSQT